MYTRGKDDKSIKAKLQKCGDKMSIKSTSEYRSWLGGQVLMIYNRWSKKYFHFISEKTNNARDKKKLNRVSFMKVHNIWKALPTNIIEYITENRKHFGEVFKHCGLEKYLSTIWFMTIMQWHHAHEL